MRPERTQVIRCNQKRNKKIEVVLTQDIASYLAAFESADVDQLIDMFLDIKELTSTFAEEIFIALPDYQFISVNCYPQKKAMDENAIKKQMNEIFKDQLRVNENEIYYSVPLICTNALEVKKTIYTIDKKSVDALVEAAACADVAIASIEAASYAYLRSLHQWDEEQYLLQVFKNRASMVSYSQVAGMFKYDCDAIAESTATEMSKEDFDKEIERVLTKNDMSAKDTFVVFNANIPVRVLSEKDAFRKSNAFENRIRPKDVFPSDIITDLSLEEQFDWMIPLGALLLSSEETDSGMYEPHPNYLSITSANILPGSIRKNSRYHRYRNLAKKYMKVLIVLLLILSVVEIGLTFYFNSFKISESLQTDYDRANIEFDQVKKEMDIITTAKSEDQEILDALEALLAQKPATIGFSDIEIGDKETAKDKDKKWMRFTIKTPDPLAIRDYTSALSQDTRLDMVNIEQIATDNGTNAKVATVNVTKRKVE